MRRMRFAIAIPQFYADGEFDPEAFRAYFARAEELGFHSAWTQEQGLGAAPQLGPVEAMTYAAACTQRLRLGCVVFVSTLHGPVHLAKSLSSLDQLSRGRLEIGVGTGGKGRPFAAFGVDPQRYVARFTEGLALMKALWTEPRVTFDGEFWQLKVAARRPAGLRLLRRRVRAHREVRRAGPDRAGGARRVGPARGGLPHRQAGVRRDRRGRRARAQADERRAGAPLRAPVGGHRVRRGHGHDGRLRPRAAQGRRGRRGTDPVHGDVRPGRARRAAGR